MSIMQENNSAYPSLFFSSTLKLWGFSNVSNLVSKLSGFEPALSNYLPIALRYRYAMNLRQNNPHD